MITKAWRTRVAVYLVAGGTWLTPAVAQHVDIAAAQKHFQELYTAGNYATAFVEAQKTEALAKRWGANSITYISALNDLARAHQMLGSYGQAAALFKRVLDALKRNIPASDPRLAQALANLGAVDLLDGYADDAEKLFKQALGIAQNALVPADPAVVRLIGNLGDVYQDEARYAEAEAQYRKALALAEENGGPDSLQAALVLNNLSKVYEDESKFAEAEDATRRALAIRERALGVNHPEVAASLNNLAHVDERLGRYAEADQLFQRAIGIWEKALGPNHPLLATALVNLASVYADQDRLDDAEALYKRALRIRELAFGANSTFVATVLNNLAAIYETEERYADVETFAKRALAIVEKSLGPDNPNTAKVLRKLGVAYDGQHRYAEAESQFRRALKIFTKAFGPDHRLPATVLISQGHLLEHEGRSSAAEQAFQRALAIDQKSLGPTHPEVARVLDELARLKFSRGDPAAALTYARKATAAILAHAQLDVARGHIADPDSGLIRQRKEFFMTHVASLAETIKTGLDTAPTLGREAFEIGQWAAELSTAAALQQLGARFGARNDGLAALVRTKQDLSSYLRERDRALVAALSKPEGEMTGGQIDTIRQQIANAERRLDAAQAQLQKDYPNFAMLDHPQPSRVEEIQKLLGPDEALVFLLTGQNESYVFSVTQGDFDWHTIRSGINDLTAKIKLFRDDISLEHLRKFDLGLAYQLYNLLLAPVRSEIAGKNHLIIVPSGPLTALPFHLLVTEDPSLLSDVRDSQVTEQSADAFREAAWFIKRHAVSILPSVTSLVVLRSVARKGAGEKPMIGFGDPAFAPGQSDDARKGDHTRGGVRSYADYWRGAGIDRTLLASALPSLPETAGELETVAKDLGASPADIHLGRDASVTAVKQARLADYRVVYFATHGLVAGDIKGLAEPALVFSLPARPTAQDNGLLTASEAAQLKLNADWVVLSACNTMAGDKPEAEALSGLARAFFYAGARALLVSHWSVDTEAATRLTTSTFATLKADPNLGRSEALRRAMLAYLDDKTSPDNAYPALWGPFAIVGEGRAKR